MKWLGLILLALLIAYLIAALLLYIKQRDLLYFPSAPVAHSYETITLTNQGEQIAITVTNPGKEKALLYWGGNGEAVAAGAAIFEKELPDYSTYLVDYRGYGRSTGIPTEAGILSDALALYDRINGSHQAVSLFGRSLGSGVACFVAAEREVDRLILITPYDSVESIARDRYPIFPLSLMIKDKYDSLSRVPHIKAKTIILIAENDTMIPKRHAYHLAEQFPEDQITVHEIHGSHHNNIAETEAYHTILKEFFNER
jgi:pimeloyl-ACP methyl ester carboxylesterase